MNNRATPVEIDPATLAQAQAFAAEFADRIRSILLSLHVTVAARFRILGLFTNPLCNRLNRGAQRIAALMARLAQGRLRRPRTTPAHPAAPPRDPQQPCCRQPPRFRLPQGQGWLARLLLHEAIVTGLHLNALLADPASQAILAAVPALARILAPIHRMLGWPPAKSAPKTAIEPAPAPVGETASGKPRPPSPNAARAPHLRRLRVAKSSFFPKPA